MDFCPKCESRLKKNSDGLLACPKCEFVKEGAVKEDVKKSEGADSEFLVMDESDMNQAKGLESTVPICLLYTSPSPRDGLLSRMPSSA